MNKTKIDWADYTWNPVKGLCPTGCWYCYARALYKRFKWDSKIRLDDKELEAPYHLAHGTSKRIFVGSTIDLFHPNIPTVWIKLILRIVKVEFYHTFIFLTKFPARYAEFDFPKNCWLGVTVTQEEDNWRLDHLKKKAKTNITFVSYEPLLGVITSIPIWVKWFIIGCLTGPHAKKYVPHRFNVALMVDAAKPTSWAKPFDIPVFLKDNLQKVWGKKLIQEFPE